MKNEYNCLVIDVAGPTWEGHCHFETAMLEAEDECHINYGVSINELLQSVGKTKNDLRNDAIDQLKEWNRNG